MSRVAAGHAAGAWVVTAWSMDLAAAPDEVRNPCMVRKPVRTRSRIARRRRREEETADPRSAPSFMLTRVRRPSGFHCWGLLEAPRPQSGRGAGAVGPVGVVGVHEAELTRVVERGADLDDVRQAGRRRGVLVVPRHLDEDRVSDARSRQESGLAEAALPRRSSPRRAAAGRTDTGPRRVLSEQHERLRSEERLSWGSAGPSHVVGVAGPPCKPGEPCQSTLTWSGRAWLPVAASHAADVR